MLRRGIALAVVVGLVAPIADLHACGDKFLRAGRSSRMKGYAAMYPATILLYPSAAAKPAVVSAWQKMLKDAGHKAQIVSRAANLSDAVASASFDLVITDYGSAARVRTDVMNARSKPAVLPVLSDSSKTAADKATAEFEHFLDPEMTNRQKLAEIDHVMEVRLKAAPINVRP